MCLRVCVKEPAKLGTTLSAMEYTLSFTNTASKPSHPLCAVSPMDLLFAPGEHSGTLYHFEGGDDIRNAFNSHTTIFNGTNGAPVQLVSKQGRSSNGVLPYFALQAPSGKALLVSVGWTGQWALSITSTAAGARVLLQHPELCAALDPQESLRSFRVFAVWADKLEVQDLFNLHRRFILSAGATRGGKLLAPVAGYLGGGAGSMGGWQTQSAFLSLLKSLDVGIEAFWLDAGWFKVRSSRLTVGCSQSSYTLLTYRVIAGSRAASRAASATGSCRSTTLSTLKIGRRKHCCRFLHWPR